MKWSEFYEKIDYYEIDKAIKGIPSLKKLGSSREIADVILVLGDGYKKYADILLKKALDKGIKFNSEELSDMEGCCDDGLFHKAIYFSADIFNDEDLENMSYIISEADVYKLAEKCGLDIPEYMLPDEEDEEKNDDEENELKIPPYDEPISWKQYYSDYSEWDEEYAKQRINALISYGNGDEIIEILYELFDGDKNSADKFIRNAINYGIKFSGNQLCEISYFCNENIFRYALEKSCEKFTDKDLEEISEVLDEDETVELADKLHLKIPEIYNDYQDEFVQGDINSMEELKVTVLCAIEIAQNTLQLLNNANKTVNRGNITSVFDMLSKNFYSSVSKNLELEEADRQIDIAKESVYELNLVLSEISDNSYVRMNTDKLASLLDLYTKDEFIDMITHMKINKMSKNIHKTQKEISDTIHKLEKLYKKLSKV